MPIDKTGPLNDEELAAFEATRDLHAELKQALADIRQGRGRVTYSPLIAARRAAGVTPQEFADFMGVSVDTLDDWEQRRQRPPAYALVMIGIILSKPEMVQSGVQSLDKQVVPPQ